MKLRKMALTTQFNRTPHDVDTVKGTLQTTTMLKLERGGSISVQIYPRYYRTKVKTLYNAAEGYSITSLHAIGHSTYYITARDTLTDSTLTKGERKWIPKENTCTTCPMPDNNITLRHDTKLKWKLQNLTETTPRKTHSSKDNVYGRKAEPKNKKWTRWADIPTHHQTKKKSITRKEEVS